MTRKSRHVGDTVADDPHFRLDRWLQADKFTLLREAVTHNLAVVHRGQ